LKQLSHLKHGFQHASKRQTSKIGCFANVHQLVSVRKFMQFNSNLHPLLREEGREMGPKQQVIGIAGVPNVYKPEHFANLAQNTRHNIQKLCELAEQECNTNNGAITIEKAVNIIDIIDEISNQLCLSLDFMELVRCIHPDPVFREAAIQSQIDVSTLLHELNNDSTIHTIMKIVENTTEINQLTELQRHCLNVLKNDMERYGSVGQDNHDHKKSKLIELSILIDKYVHEFSDFVTKYKNSLANSSQLVAPIDANDPIIRDLVKRFPSLFNIKSTKGKEQVIVSYQAIYHSSSQVRKIGYIAENAASEHSLIALDKLLAVRHELAHALNKPSFAHHQLSSLMIQTPERAKKFLKDISDKIKPKAEEEIEHLKQEKMIFEGESLSRNVYVWDIAFYRTIFESKQNANAMRLSEIKNYLHYENCISGICNVCEQLFNVKIRRTPLGKYESWDEKIIKFQIYDESTGEHLGDIYMDIFSREYKVVESGNFCRQLAKTTINQKPVSVVALNFSNDFLNINELISLFHEFGHAMHVIFGQTPYQNLSGTRVSIDWAEMPSQFMEHFATDYRVVSQFAKHYKTGEVLPESLFNYAIKRRNMFKALDTQDQLVYAMLDIVLHLNEHKQRNLTTTQMLYQIRSEFHSAPITENDSIDQKYPISYHGNLLHFTNYPSSYYSYLYAKIAADHLWYKDFHPLENPLNPNAAVPLKKALSYGGSKKEIDILTEMLSGEPNPSYFLSEFQITE
jgi:intermediate peptidase